MLRLGKMRPVGAVLLAVMMLLAVHVRRLEAAPLSKGCADLMDEDCVIRNLNDLVEVIKDQMLKQQRFMHTAIMRSSESVHGDGTVHGAVGSVENDGTVHPVEGAVHGWVRGADGSVENDSGGAVEADHGPYWGWTRSQPGYSCNTQKDVVAMW